MHRTVALCNCRSIWYKSNNPFRTAQLATSCLKIFILRKLKMFCNCAIPLSITMLYYVWKVRRNGNNAFDSLALLPKHLITRMTEISNKILLGAHKMHLEIFIIEPIFTISWSSKLDARYDVNQVNTFATKSIFVTINSKKSLSLFSPLM